MMTPDLSDLVAQIRACRICRDTPLKTPLPHEPNPVVVASSVAKVLIAGQAPGTRVHETGIPFNDRSGDRLRQWLDVSREEFYDPDRFAIVPMGFCFPGQDAKGSDLPPRRECAPAWRGALLEKMPQIEFVLAVGGYAQAWHLGSHSRATLSESVADWRAIVTRNTSPRILPLPHPSWRNTAWLKRNPWFETDLLPFLQKEIRIHIGPRS